MMAAIGFILLLCALFCASLQTILPAYGLYKNNSYLLASARLMLWLQTIFVVMAYILLTIAFVTNDYSIEYVAANSHPNLPFMYRLTATWGGHEGSILLWALLLCFWSCILSFVHYPYKLKVASIAILGAISFCFLAFLFFTSNPFLPAVIIYNPRDLNPLLQDPGFVIHPPMLYVGYVGFAATFALTVTGLLYQKLDQNWAKITRRFALGAWGFLTFGIMLGSWWAYHVLGWGGFWFWDPVENASLLPWLSGVALIHVLVLVEKKGSANYWAAFIAILCFALSLLGTFLVRSGVLVSAHTFANDPARGVYLLLFFALVMVSTLMLFFIRYNQFKRRERSKRSYDSSREVALLINSALVTVIMLTILLGTLYPLILDALQLGAISVGAPYFNLALTPLIIVLLFFMALAPFYFWEQASLLLALKKSWPQLLFSILLTTLILLHLGKMQITPFIVTVLAIWLILNLCNKKPLKLGMYCTHFGFAVFMLGVLLSSAYSQESQLKMRPGDVANMGPYQFYFIGIKSVDGPNYRGIRAAFEINKGSRHITYLLPEKRIYPVREMIMSKVAIHPTLFRDLYMALGEPLNNDDWSVRLYYKPFIRWIWLGGIIMMMGGFFSLRKVKGIT